MTREYGKYDSILPGAPVGHETPAGTVVWSDGRAHVGKRSDDKFYTSSGAMDNGPFETQNQAIQFILNRRR